MPVYLIPSEEDIRNYLNDYETEGMSKETLLRHIYDIIYRFQRSYPAINLDAIFALSNVRYETFIRNIIPFLVLNSICRVYYADLGGRDSHYELFPHSESNQDKELFLILNDIPTQSIDKETFESSYTRLDKNGNYIPVKI